MNVTDFRRSSPAIILGTSTDTMALGGVTVSSNASPGDGWVFVSTGSNSGIWRNALAFGSNTNDVSSVGSAGASASNSRADHVHRGVGAITAAGSNPVYGTVNLQAGDNIAITTAAGSLTIAARPVVSSLSHSSNTFTGAVTLTTPGDSVGITSPAPGTFALTAAGGSGGGGGSSGLSSGTAFPASPATGDTFFRTDLGLLFFYDGTRWLTTEVFVVPFLNDVAVPFTTTGQFGRTSIPPLLGGSDLYMLGWQIAFYVVGGTALSGSHKWVGAMNKNPSGTTIATITINSGASSAYRQLTGTINDLLTASTQIELDLGWTKTGTPGNLFPWAVVFCRIVAT